MDIGRKITVEYLRNKEKDTVVDGINYTGYDIHWPSSGPASTQIEKFCEVGTRTILGGETPEKAIVELYFIPCKDEATTKPKLPTGMKCRRMYIVKGDGQARMHFKNGMETEMLFCDTDDQRVKDWVDFSNLEQGVKNWFDFFAVVPFAKFELN